VVDPTQQANRAVAAWVAGVIGGRPAARRWYRTPGDQGPHIDLGFFVDRPGPGVTSYSTLGLSDTPIPGAVRPPLGAELLGACDATATGFPALLAEIAFRVKVDGRRCEPDAIFDHVAPTGMSSTLRHAILLPPFLWDDDAFASRVIDYKTVAWLQVVAITDAERHFCLDRGSGELQTRFEKAEIDVLDPDRPSVV
jgi:hypothetical protein